MPIRVALRHQTVYEYDRPVKLSPQVIRLRPAPHCRTAIPAYSLKIDPNPHFLNWQQDPNGNYLARVVFPEKTRRFSVDVDLVAEMTVINPFDFFLEPYAEEFPFQYDETLERQLAPFREVKPAGAKLQALLDSIDLTKRRTMDFLVSINQRLQGEIRYLIRLEPGVQSSEETLTNASGSCRDTAWLEVEILRHLGLAARFVSGYLIQLRPDQKSLDGPSGAEQDFTDLHAWAEVYLPGAGWVGLDPTSGLLAGEGHLPLAASADPSSAAPVEGSVDPCEVEFDHRMFVTRVHEDPRVTLPYTDQQWECINTLGVRIDQDLEAHDVRLTMGGEPTFVSIDDMDGAEWNTTALGTDKRKLAEKLLDRLRDRLAPGGLLHYGQGKWFPGEPLPRWALTCYWRRDGVPLWQDPSLLAKGMILEDGRRPPEPGPAAARSDASLAQRFAETLAAKLGFDRRFVQPAFEDPLHYSQRERLLPVNVEPGDNLLDHPVERERIKRILQRGLETPVGMVLPLQRGTGEEGSGWQTSIWPLRSKQLYLVPGDSPMGFRLPLPSLPWVDPGDADQVHPADPFEERDTLPDPRQSLFAAPHAPPSAQRERRPDLGESASWVVRTALCIEPRFGRLHIFMPPVPRAEDYTELLALLEEVAAELRTPVVIEGYTPPFDPRIEHIKVTPDPGVIEVNIPPTHSWAELVAGTTELYEDARQSRLGTEKFMLDGRHTGTGGGNHLVLGGPTPADSPFLRRPDLLRSFVGYWINHPSLSYLFSTIFIGPTSQAPRVDETRADNLYELEIAFGLVPEPGKGECPPWLVDRLFRHLLVDVTGNTHRAEFCIDKLYSPDSSTGRLGLLELRGFEMPPHARMSLTQQLLVRALLAWFWKQPYLAKPVRWGTRLHDEFMLPFFCGEDFRDVLDDLIRAGYPFDMQWFAPHFEFRYPVCGSAHHAGIDLEIRQATEPWYVLGEEATSGGTARYVDSSVERVQIKANGIVGERHLITCNGRQVPLRFTGKHGEFVAGVRYRAWQPPSCLHPTIPVHAPLIFDVYDKWTGRSLGGCTYHVAHPGGRNSTIFPVNANEAESRRAARFVPFGHTPGKMRAPLTEHNPDFPLTLDLRRPMPHATEVRPWNT